jgi:Flp pilus assembly protein TadD
MRKVVLGVLSIAAIGAAMPSYAIETAAEKRERRAMEAQKKLAPLLPKCIDAFNQGRYDDSIAGCTAIIDSKIVKDENLGTVYFVRGSAHERKGDCVAAMADFEIAQPLLSTDPQLYVAQFVCATKLKDDAKAAAALDKAMELKPDDMDLLRARCIMRVNAKNIAAAIPDCEKFIAARPDDATVWLALGQMYEVEKKNDLAKNAYTKVLALKPDTPSAADGLKRLGGAK